MIVTACFLDFRRYRAGFVLAAILTAAAPLPARADDPKVMRWFSEP